MFYFTNFDFHFGNSVCDISLNFAVSPIHKISSSRVSCLYKSTFFTSKDASCINKYILFLSYTALYSLFKYIFNNNIDYPRINRILYLHILISHASYECIMHYNKKIIFFKGNLYKIRYFSFPPTVNCTFSVAIEIKVQSTFLNI